MNILVLTSSFPTGPEDGQAAAGLFVLDFCRALASLGNRVDVITPDKPGVKHAWPDLAVSWLSWPGGDRPLSQVRLHNPLEWPGVAALIARFPPQILRHCRNREIDAVLAMWAVPGGWWASRVRRAAGIPYVTWCLGSDIWVFGRKPVLRRAVARALDDSSAVFANSLYLAGEIERLFGHRAGFLAASRFIDPGAAAPVPAPARRPRFFFLGRYMPVKGPDVLLDAMERYVAAGGTGELVLRGGGPLETALRARAAADPLAGRVAVGGYADLPTALGYLRSSDVQIIPSRRESLPVILIDAVKASRPVIVTDVGDSGAVVRRYGAGLVVPSEDSEALAGAMLAIDRDGTAPYKEGVAAAAAAFDTVAAARVMEDALRAAVRKKG